MQAHAEAVSPSEAQAEIMARLEAVSRLPLRPDERARFAGRLTQARTSLEAARIARRALEVARRDFDPYDRERRSGLSRGGYVRVGR